MKITQYPDIPIFDKIDEVMSLISLHPTGISAIDLLKETGYPRTTLYRILYQLEKKGYLILNQMTRLYFLGPKLLYLRSSDIEQHSILQNCASPFLIQLAYKINQTVKLSVRVGFSSEVLCHTGSSESLLTHLRVGTIYPLHAGAASKILLSTLTDREMRLYFSMNTVAYTSSTITALNVMEQEFEQIKEQGFALDNGEYIANIGGIAVPITDKNEHIIAAASIAFHIKEMEKNQAYITDLKETAAEISAAFRSLLEGRTTNI